MEYDFIVVGAGSAAALVVKLPDVPPPTAFRLAAIGNLSAGDQIADAIRRAIERARDGLELDPLDRDGRGLGLVASDLDSDGLMDIYVANEIRYRIIKGNRL